MTSLQTDKAITKSISMTSNYKMPCFIATLKEKLFQRENLP